MRDLIREIKSDWFGGADGITVVRRLLAVLLVTIGFIAMLGIEKLGFFKVSIVLIFCAFVGICADVKSAFKE